MKINQVFIFITMAVVFFAMSSAQPNSFERMYQNYIRSLISRDCTADDQCDPKEKCVNGKCFDQCYPYPCGENTGCTHINHEAVCECLYDYTGNPLVGCTPMEQKERYEKILRLEGEEVLKIEMADDEKMKRMMEENRKKYQHRE